ncbi:NADH dehydrogenase ubiquinone Fe-S protein 4 mitochondrial [Penicillium cf. griseofulvum]|uniref:NADH dehydrogenase [ubiquinone] iron-sulfur protein 4, mitochondrial n=1 Tax=Penicillium cf. griseofulvum TaxID=2972120 RepID=A0A9W9MQS7_9EURO|nr:NADH dehydrogenase ubiquinone Fe-S protein 4 mitochondrial [Penicillium cf. griseofulvum]KAJ5441245.1 NADH dehydrogenase ubiquinone Fe-S protein 4 mitochondrial [Penicillium cf. griseofulvum]KAJ5449295.1 NADH dehydrogenase ubiquinone Fe-S protein 4 mitochondrial [Penicillium cf. griseofulvum]
MSLFRIGGAASLRVSRLAAPVNARFVSVNAPKAVPSVKTTTSDAPTTPPKDSSLITKETPSEAFARHQPDYEATIDHGTSQFSPVPKRVMDGSEPGNSLPAAILSGAPTDLQARTVRIYRPTKPATQSGTWHQHHWRMDWDILQRGHRWENSLMGWQSSADCMQGTNLKFKSKEDAINFAQKQGYEYFVQEPNERRFVPKSYANNFVHEPKKLRHIKTK